MSPRRRVTDPAPSLTPDEQLVWEAWRLGYHRRAEITPGPMLKHIRVGLRHLGVDRTVRLIQWAHEAPHERACWLRGADYEPGKTGAYLKLKNLLVAENLDERDGWAEEWEQAGRPHYTTAPRRLNGHGPRDRPLTLLDQLREMHAEDEPPPPPRIRIDPLTGDRTP